jgi:hypothetical protein
MEWARWVCAVSFLSGMGLAWAAEASTVRSQNFDSASAASAQGWKVWDPPVYNTGIFTEAQIGAWDQSGWSGSNVAGGASGEGYLHGGPSQGGAAYYADDTIGNINIKTTAFSASGRVQLGAAATALGNSYMMVGFFDKDKARQFTTNGHRNDMTFLGLAWSPSQNQYRHQAQLPNGSGQEEWQRTYAAPTGATLPPADVAMEFVITWDPAGGRDPSTNMTTALANHGLLTVDIKYGGYTFENPRRSYGLLNARKADFTALNVPLSEIDGNAGVSAFGLFIAAYAEFDMSSVFYYGRIDEASYSAIPEPSAIAAVALVGVGLCRRRRTK